MIDVLIINWNTKEKIEECLNALFEMIDEIPYKVLITVVDNGSIDGSVEYLDSLGGGINLIKNRSNLGYAKAVNIGLKSMQMNEFVLLLNSDALVNSVALEGMVSYLDQNSDVAGVTPSLKINREEYQFGGAGWGPSLFTVINSFLFMEKINSYFRGLFINQRYYSRCVNSVSVTWIAFACALIRRDALSEVGQLNEKFFVYAEDCDWCWRAVSEGWKFGYLPYLNVYHELAGSSENRGLTNHDWYVNLLKVFKQNVNPPKYIAILLVALLGWLIRFLIFIPLALFRIKYTPRRDFYFNMIKITIVGLT